MNITSILITIVGIIVIIALYLMSRIAQSKLPQKHTNLLPDLKDENGDKFTSVLDDIPAQDGFEPKPGATRTSTPQKNDVTETQKQQVILFISANNDSGLDGNLIQKSLNTNGLVLGDNDIYHYIVETQSSKTSLFRVANGVAPWTLKQEDLAGKKLVGLSLVMLISGNNADKKGITTYIRIAEKLSSDINGILKNQQQQVFTDRDKKLLIS